MRAALILLPLLAAAPALAQPTVLLRLAPPAGVGQLLLPDGAAPPLVILLPDALGSDRREDAYRDALWVRGVATLLLGLGEDREIPEEAVEPAARPEAARAAIAYARAAGFGAIGLLGFGLGGRAGGAGVGRRGAGGRALSALPWSGGARRAGPGHSGRRGPQAAPRCPRGLRFVCCQARRMAGMPPGRCRPKHPSCSPIRPAAKGCARAPTRQRQRPPRPRRPIGWQRRSAPGRAQRARSSGDEARGRRGGDAPPRGHGRLAFGGTPGGTPGPCRALVRDPSLASARPRRVGTPPCATMSARQAEPARRGRHPARRAARCPAGLGWSWRAPSSRRWPAMA